MAYYSGTAADYSALRTALFDACVANGWTLATDTLTKDSAVVRVTISASNTVTIGPGIILQGATSLSGTDLVNASPITPRFGPLQQIDDQLVWPLSYEIFIFNDPDEVFLVANFNIDYYLWLSFGVSDVPSLGGTGLWLSASSRGGRGSPNAGAKGVAIGLTTGGISSDSSYSSAAFFWDTAQYTIAPYVQNSSIHVGLDGVTWSGVGTGGLLGTIGSCTGISSATTHLANQPNAWNSEAILLPIQLLFFYTGNKSALVGDINNARYVRVDNYTPGQVITLGSEQWKVFPFYRKNSAARNGGSANSHTGTFGWAIRYDGP